MFKSYSEFLVCLSNCDIGKEWTVVHKGNVVIFAIISLSSTSIPDISISATFDHNLELKLYQNHCELRKMCDENYPKNLYNIKDIVSVLDNFQKQHNKTTVTFDNAFVIYYSLLHSISSHVYRYLRSCAFLNIPHPKTIQKICSKYNCNPRDEQSKYNFLRYIKQKFNLLSESDIIVTLMIDEIKYI